MAPVIPNADAVATKVEGLIKDSTVMVFSKSTCPFCRRVKNFFTDNKVIFKAIELDQMGEEGAGIQDYLFKKTGQKTVPSVFIRGGHIGKHAPIHLLYKKSGKVQKIQSIMKILDFLKCAFYGVFIWCTKNSAMYKNFLLCLFPSSGRPW